MAGYKRPDLPNFSESPKKNKLMRILFGADLRSGHAGLWEQAKKDGFNVDTLGVGEYVCFVNRRKTGVKMFASGKNMLGYFKTDHGQINVKVIQALPRYFNGGQIHYPEALREQIIKEVRVT